MAKTKGKKTTKGKKEKTTIVDAEVEKDSTATEEQMKNKDSVEESIPIKRFRGLLLRILPFPANLNRWYANFIVGFFGMHKLDYVWVKIVNPNNVIKSHLIPFKELVRIKKRVYYLCEEFRIRGDFGISTYFFHFSSSSPINMSKTAWKLDSDIYDKVLKNVVLDAVNTGKTLKGGGISMLSGKIWLYIAIGILCIAYQFWLKPYFGF